MTRPASLYPQAFLDSNMQHSDFRDCPVACQLGPEYLALSFTTGIERDLSAGHALARRRAAKYVAGLRLGKANTTLGPF